MKDNKPTYRIFKQINQFSLNTIAMQLFSNYNLYFTLFFIFVFTALSNAQIKEETARTQKIYEPEVQKIQKKNTAAEIPALSPEEKKNIQYNITDIEPVSDFTTSDLPPNEIEDLPQEKLYHNYVKAGYGNFSHLLVDGYAAMPITESGEIGIRLLHNSTAGINDYKYNVDTDYAKNSGEVFFQSTQEYGKLHFDIGYDQEHYNLFGSSFPEEYFLPTTKAAVEQNVKQFHGKAAYQTFTSEYFKNASINARYLTDDFNSKELSTQAKARGTLTGYEMTFLNFDFKLGAEAEAFLNLTNTQFEKETALKTNYFHTGITPLIKLYGDKADIKLGASIQYLSEGEQGNSDLFFYPSAEFKYKGLESYTLFAGITGGLETNSYQSLLARNPYLFPNQVIAPTETLYNIYAGINGAITENISFSGEAGYSKANNIAFFSKRFENGFTDFTNPDSAYQKFNTFTTLYDDGNILNVKGNIHYLAIENLSLGLGIDYKTYDLKNYSKILNTPNLTADITANYKLLNGKLLLDSKLFFVGSRKTNEYTILTSTPTYTFEENIKTLNSYLDANLSATYLFKPNISFFVKGMNLLNPDYENFQNYQVQGLQILGGVLFKF